MQSAIEYIRKVAQLSFVLTLILLFATVAWTMAQIPAGVRIFPQTLARYSTRR